MIITNIFVEFLGTLAIVFIYLFTNGNPFITGAVFTFFLFLSESLGGQGQLNPAITLAQMLGLTNNSTQNSLFIIAQIIGAILGILTYKLINK